MASEKLRTVQGNCSVTLLLRGAAVLAPVRLRLGSAIAGRGVDRFVLAAPAAESRRRAVALAAELPLLAAAEQPRRIRRRLPARPCPPCGRASRPRGQPSTGSGGRRQPLRDRRPACRLGHVGLALRLVLAEMLVQRLGARCGWRGWRRPAA